MPLFARALTACVRTCRRFPRAPEQSAGLLLCLVVPQAKGTQRVSCMRVPPTPSVCLCDVVTGVSVYARLTPFSH
jgi:hypothetical protein